MNSAYLLFFEERCIYVAPASYHFFLAVGVYDGHAWAAMALGMATDFKFHVVGPFPFLFVPPDRKFNTNAGLSSAAGILELVVPTPMFLVQRAATQAAAARLKEEVSLPLVFFRIGFASCDDVASLFP